MAKDIITALERDHREVEKLFARYERVRGRPDSARARTILTRTFDEIRRELSIHAAAEEMVLYPEIRSIVPAKGDSLANEGLAEHGRVKRALAALENLDPAKAEFDVRMEELLRDVRHHVKEEERDILDDLRRRLPRARLVELGGAIERAKAVAPTHPHPGAPDRPPANLLVGLAAGALDRARDAVGSLLGGSEEKKPPATRRPKAKRKTAGPRSGPTKKATARGRSAKSSRTKTAAKKGSRRRTTTAGKPARAKSASDPRRGKAARVRSRASKKK